MEITTDKNKNLPFLASQIYSTKKETVGILENFSNPFERVIGFLIKSVWNYYSMTKTDNAIAAKLSTISKFLKIFVALTEADLIRGKNGRALYHDWSRLPGNKRDEDCRQVNEPHKVKGRGEHDL